MKIKMIRGTDPKAAKKITEILAIYNTDKGLNESFEMVYPEKCFIIYIKGKAGGLIVETIFRGGAFIYYAAFASHDRQKGFLTACIDEYNNLTVHKILGVQLNPFDDFGFWERRGFPPENQIMFNWTITRLNITPEELNIKMKKYPNNDNF